MGVMGSGAREVAGREYGRDGQRGERGSALHFGVAHGCKHVVEGGKALRDS